MSNKKGFGITSLIAKIILVALFILLLIWLFRNYSPNMKPFYNNIFRENISYMQDAAKGYYTKDKLPLEVGETSRLTLKEMEEMKLLIPFVDKNGKACDGNKSYVEITKEEIGYTLKVNLVCGKESNYIIETLGCHDFCNNCDSKTAIEYEFTRTTSKNITELSCPKGYTRNNNMCTKKTGSETINATKNYTQEKVEYANVLYTSGALQIIELASVRNVTTKTEKQYTDKITTTKTEKEYIDVNRVVTEDCYDERIKDPNCRVQCKWEVGSDGIPREVCNTCGYIVHRVCTDVTSYVCPNGYINEGSGSSTKCYRNVTTETYSCPSGYTKEGSGSSLKCYKNVTTETVTYSCPADATSNNGRTGAYLKCYKSVEGEKVPYCENPNAVIKNNKCVLTIPSEFSHYSCPSGYELDNKKGTCSKDIIDTIKATSTTKENKTTETKWSRSKVLEGWTATGKTRTVKVN